MNNAKCCVIITAKNEAHTLPALLTTLAQQTILPTQIVIAVAASQDDTLKIAKSCRIFKTVDYQVIDVGLANRSVGRNLAVQKANQPILVFTDAGCLPLNNWLEELLSPFEHRQSTSQPTQSTQVVSGYTFVEPKNCFELLQAFFVLVPLSKTAINLKPATRNMAITKDLFIKLDGFKNELNYAEDYEFANRLIARKIKTVFRPTARVNWQARPNLASYIQMIANLTAGDFEASTVRFGQFSMLIRYVMLITVFVLNQSLGFAFGVIYLLLKSAWLAKIIIKEQFKLTTTCFLLLPLLQLVTDLAVLLGIIRGIGKKI